MPLLAQQPGGPPAATSHADFSLAFRFGTPGFGLEANKLLANHLGARLGGAVTRVDVTQTQSNINYAATLKFHSLSVLIDLYPSARGSFHVSGGLVTNPVTISATGQPATSGTFKVNGVTYTANQVGVLTGTGKYPDVCPYLGFGFGTPVRHGAVAFLFDFGAVIGKPSVSLTATGAATNPALATDLQTQSTTTQHDVDKYLKIFPVVAFGFAYRF